MSLMHCHEFFLNFFSLQTTFLVIRQRQQMLYFTAMGCARFIHVWGIFAIKNKDFNKKSININLNEIRHEIILKRQWHQIGQRLCRKK